MKLNTKFNYPKSIRAYHNGQRLYDVNSEKLPSVTTILNVTKSEREKAKLEEWRKRVGAKAADLISKQALSRGSSMHDFLEKFILNQLNLDLLGDNSLEKQMADQVPLMRIAEPIEVANAVVFLASDKARYISGVNLPVDGGRTKSL